MRNTNGSSMNHQMPTTLIIMGVSGCGKSSIGAQLAQAIGGTFADADDFHPPANLEKMAHGIPLTDADRSPWLQILRNQIVTHPATAGPYVLACSALKQRYRDLLRGHDSPEILRFIYLKGSKELIRQRLATRQHFMPSQLLDSQFETLEEPREDGNLTIGDRAIVIDIRLTPDEILDRILDALHSALH
jgi:gluconokinase